MTSLNASSVAMLYTIIIVLVFVSLLPCKYLWLDCKEVYHKYFVFLIIILPGIYLKNSIECLDSHSLRVCVWGGGGGREIYI